METVSFTTGQHTAFLLLVSTGEVKTTQVCTGVDLTTCHTDEFRTSADGLEDGLIGVDIRMLLIDVTDLYGLAYAERTLVGFLRTDDHTEEGGLTGAVRTDHTDDTVRR